MGVRPFFWMLVCLLPAGEGLAQTDARERVVESNVPWLDYNSSCWPALEPVSAFVFPGGSHNGAHRIMLILLDRKCAEPEQRREAIPAEALPA
jgi:hypothetical protein